MTVIGVIAALPAVLVVVIAMQSALLIGAFVRRFRRAGWQSWWSNRNRSRELRLAVLRGEIVPHYQPIVRASDGVPVGFEALARWNHPRLGVLSAGQFLDLAEQRGYMAVIDRRMLIAVARDLPALMDRLDAAADPFVTVNLSPRRLAQPGYARDILGSFAEAGLSGDGLVIEMTEASVVVGWPSFMDNVTLFQDAGIGLALDDFGSGHANLTLLAKLDVDLVKLDRSVVELAMAVPDVSTIVEGAIATARAGGALIVAEGVSQLEWVPALLRLDVDFVQGFGIGYPRSMSEFSGGPNDPVVLR